MSLLPVTVPARFTTFVARCVLAGVPVASAPPFGPIARAGEPQGPPGEPEKAEAMLEKACARILEKVEGLEKQGKTEEAMAALQASPLGRVLEAWARIDRTLAEKEFEHKTAKEALAVEAAMVPERVFRLLGDKKAFAEVK